MKRIVVPALGLFLIFFTACNNTNTKKGDHSTEISKTTADSLYDDVMDGHNVAMAKYGKLQAMDNEATRLIDSIVALPVKAQQAAVPLKTKLIGLLKDLKSAREKMDEWMQLFNPDSAVNNVEQRIKYMAGEKIKVSEIKESILSTLQKADSIVKAKF